MSRLALLLLLPLVAFVCGNRRPAILNATQAPIEVRTVHSDGSVASGRLAPGTRLFLGDPPRHPREVEIVLPTGQRFSYSVANAPGLLGGAPPEGATVGWKVSESGVTPLMERELD